jgi:TetR/AcrR family fatty acid metabolism transcriptional regulator
VSCAFLEKYRHGKNEDRRNHILDAAFTIFIENGVHSAKMEDIARAAGYGKSTLYEYFDSKDEILSELMRVKFVDRFKLIAEEAEREPTPEGKLRAFLIAEMNMFTEYKGKERIENLLASDPELVQSSNFFQTLNEIIMFKFEHIAGYIGEGIEDGSFRKTDVYIAAAVVIGSAMTYHGTVNSPVYQAVAIAEGATDEDHLENYFDLIFHALRK